MKKTLVLMTLLVLPVLSGSVSAMVMGAAGGDLMAIWDFGPNKDGYTEDVTTENVVGTPELTLNGGEIDDNGKNGTSYTDSAGTFHDVGQAAAWKDLEVSGKDAEWIMKINTTGFEDMTIRWDHKAWNSDTDSFDFGYRVNGGEWQKLLKNEPMTGDETYYSFSKDLSYISAIEDQPVVEFRLDDLDRGDGDGKYAFDNLELTGSVIPEPCSVVLLALAGIKVLRKRERKNVAVQP